MQKRYLRTHTIDKKIFRSDKRIKDDSDALIKSNKSLKNKFNSLEENLRKG